MKKLILTFVALFTITVATNAMSYEQARQQALFLADKMAYELNLTEEQYEAVYEINLDYLMSINTRDDLYGAYWRQRNLDMSYILLDWQYNAFCAANYFYRPLYWDAGYWHFAIYARYPHRSYLYFGRPSFWTVYRGGHSWRVNGGRSWYHGRNLRPRPNTHHIGMRDHFDHKGPNRKNDKGFGHNSRPDNRTFDNNNHDKGRNDRRFGTHNQNRDNNRTFGNNNNRNVGHDNNRGQNNRNVGNDNNRGQNNRTFGGSNDRFQNNNIGRESSTRTTVTNGDSRRFNGARSSDIQSSPSTTQKERSSVTAPSNSTRSTFGSSSRPSSNRNSFGSSSHSSGSSRGGGHFGGRR